MTNILANHKRAARLCGEHAGGEYKSGIKLEYSQTTLNETHLGVVFNEPTVVD